MSLLRLLDFSIFLAVSVISTFGVIICVPFKSLLNWSPNPVLVSLTRFADTIELHRRLNSPAALEKFYERPWVFHSIMLCAGNAAGRVERLGTRVIGCDVHIPESPLMTSYFPRTMHAVRDVCALIVTIRFLRRRRAAVVEVMSPSWLMWRGTMLRWLLPVRLVTQVRGNLDLAYAIGTPSVGRPLRQALALAIVCRHKFMAQLFFRSCDQVVGYNVNNMTSAISNGAHPAKTYLSRIRVDRAIVETTVRPRQAIECFPEKGRVICLWSRLAREKLVGTAMEGALPVLRQHADVSFVIIGDGDERRCLETFAKQSDMKDRIIFTGYRDRAYIHSAAVASDVVVVPYGGSSLLEAALFARPVVAFDLEWHRELVRDGETGWLADFRSPTQIAECLNEALECPREAKRRSQALYHLAVYMFDEEKIAKNEARIMGEIFPKARLKGYGRIKRRNLGDTD